jgi:hypothetical protein
MTAEDSWRRTARLLDACRIAVETRNYYLLGYNSPWEGVMGSPLDRGQGAAVGSRVRARKG